jgi:hypothetical protein
MQLDHGAITRIRPPLEAHRLLQNSVRLAMGLVRAVRCNILPDECAVHGLARTPCAASLSNWWHRRLLQHTPDLLAELVGMYIVVF